MSALLIFETIGAARDLSWKSFLPPLCVFASPGALRTLKNACIGADHFTRGSNIRPSQKLLLIGTSAGFAAAGGLTRVHLLSVATRVQIAAFWILALAVYLMARRRLGLGASRAGLVLNGIAATVAIIFAKWSVEGWPPFMR
jgi:hypothetical protein